MLDELMVNFNLGRSDLGEHLTRTRRYLVGDVLRKNARTNPDTIAAVGVGGEEQSYGELNDRVNRLIGSVPISDTKPRSDSGESQYRRQS